METGFLMQRRSVDKYLPLHKDRIIITKGGADRNTSIEKIIEAIDAYRPLTPEGYRCYPRFCSSILLRFAWFRDNIQLAQNHDVVDTADGEAVDNIIEKALMVNLLQIFSQIVLHLYQGKHLKTFRCKDFMDLYGSLCWREGNLDRCM